jgi:hypothetical protein
VATVAAGKVEGTGARARVHGDGLLDDEAIGNKLANRLAGVGIADLADLAGVEPDLALADAQDGGRKPLLGPQINPVERQMSAFRVDVVGLFVLGRGRCWEIMAMAFSRPAHSMPILGYCEAGQGKSAS